MAVVEPVQEGDLDLSAADGTELISDRKSIHWNRDQLWHIVVQLVAGIDVHLPVIVALYQ